MVMLKWLVFVEVLFPLRHLIRREVRSQRVEEFPRCVPSAHAREHPGVA